MKFSIVCLLSLILSIYGTGEAYTVNGTEGREELSNFAVNISLQSNDLKIIDSATEVKLGGIGFITIEGKPGVRYMVTSSFKAGNKTIPVHQWRTTDSTGHATFIWVVSSDTAPGTYPITISGNDETLNLTHVVIP